MPVPRSRPLVRRSILGLAALQLFTVGDLFGGWTKAQTDHFDDGGLYVQIIASARR